MNDIIFELAVNLYQSFMFIGFLYLFFEKKFQKGKNILLFFVFVTISFSVFTYFTFNLPYFTMVDSVLHIIVFEIYVLLCLKGNMVLKVVMPFIAFLINTIISYAFMYSMSFFAGMTFEEIALQSSLYRYICAFLVNLTNLFVYLILLKINAKNYNLKSASNIIAFIGIPILTMTIVYMTTYILILTDYQPNIMPYIITICFSMVVIAVVVWYMISRISRDNNIKTELLLSELRADMYEKNIVNSSRQIEEMARVKHDIKNNIACIDELVVNNNSDDAHKICIELLNKMQAIYTPINTENPTLNAVLNVELEKAKSNNIDFKIEINDEMLAFRNNTDIISVIGNLCDNAIEYLSVLPEELRQMELNISKHYNYSIIACKNKITSSVLGNNPDLNTSKSDTGNHGKGLSIIKDIVRKYNGNINYREIQNSFIAILILEPPILPENA